MVTALSIKLDELVGPIIQRTATERHDGGHQWIRLRHRPLSAITSVTEYSSGVATVLTAEDLATAGDYQAERDNEGLLTGYLFRRSGFGDTLWAAGRQNIAVVATAGRYADTAAAAGSRFAEAARLTLKALWRAEMNGTQNLDEFDVPTASFPTSMIPQVARDLLVDQMQRTFVG